MQVTKTCKVMRRKATSNHFLQKKSASRKRKFAGVQQITGGQLKSIKRNLGV